MKHSLAISNLQVKVAQTPIVHDLNITIMPGEIHALMGPNGSGKSTTAAVLAGHPEYEVVAGSILLDGEEIKELSPDERARRGLFLAFQYPVEVPGVRVQNFLRVAHQARFGDIPGKNFVKAIEFRKHLTALASQLDINHDFLKRGLNENFSGGEKKQLEILQMALLEPRYAFLDETDSGLDIDAIKKVAKGVQFVKNTHSTGLLIITHYKRILEYIRPDFVHVMIGGRVVQSGGPELVDKLEAEGYTTMQRDATGKS